MNNKPLGQLSNDEYYELMSYRCLGTIEELTALKRKNLPMRATEFYDPDKFERMFKCPSCYTFSFFDKKGYCQNCGQRIVVPDNVKIGGD